MKIIDVDNPDCTLKEVVQAIKDGQTVRFEQAGKPIGEAVPSGPVEKRPIAEMFGKHKGKIWIADDFDAPLSEEELALWDGDDENDLLPRTARPTQ